MSYTNYAAREINFKVVYFGPALSGKSTNLKYIFDRTSPDAKGKMLTLTDELDMRLFFDFLPSGLTAIRGFAPRFHLYTVPGENRLDASLKDVLKGVDGVVFVADSRPDRQDFNAASLRALAMNLQDLGFNASQIPTVFQYNYRDAVDAVAVETLRAMVNPSALPEFQSVASTGQGVFETLKAVVKLVISKK